MENPFLSEKRNWQQSKLLAGLEVMLAVLIIVGHNAFNIGRGNLLFNEVFLIFVLGSIFLRLRDEGWRSVGFQTPDNWSRTVRLALVIGILIPVVRTLIELLVTAITHQPPLPSSVEPSAGNLLSFAKSLLVTWTFAAFGEEFVYRAYLMNRIADLGDRTPLAWGISLVSSSILFGIGHFYQGLPGIVGGLGSGLLLGGLYLYQRRNLWANILAHGVADTIVFLLLFLNLVD